MRWITAWLGALKGAVVVVETRQAWLSRPPDKFRLTPWRSAAEVARNSSTLSGVVPKLPNQWSGSTRREARPVQLSQFHH